LCSAMTTHIQQKAPTLAPTPQTPKCQAHLFTSVLPYKKQHLRPQHLASHACLNSPQRSAPPHLALSGSSGAAVSHSLTLMS
jgi:hypothetical protein